MNGEEIGDRFKDYESCWDFSLPRRLPLVIRVDGRAFHSLKLQKPFDHQFVFLMAETAKALCEEIQGARWAYFQSDEISIIARDDMSLQSQPWVGKRLSKILSLSAAIAASAFNRGGYGYLPPQQFDARAFVVPTLDEAINYTIWRQLDATRNSVSMLARSVFSHKECHQQGTADLRAMLEAKGKRWEDYPTHLKRGAIIRPVTRMKLVPQTGTTVARRSWEVDREAPIFTQERGYLEALWEGPAAATDAA